MSNRNHLHEFESTMRNTHVRIRCYIAGLGFRPEEVDTIAIDTFGDFFENIEQAPSDLAPQSWLKQLARAACLRYLQEVNPPDMASRLAMMEILSDVQTPLQKLIGLGELEGKLNAGQRDFSEEERQFVQGKYADQSQLTDINSELNEGKGTPAVTLLRLRSQLIDRVTN